MIARLFFIFWICSNIFRNFLGCSVRFQFLKRSLDWSFHKLSNALFQIILLQKLFIFWIRSNIFRDFTGCKSSILISDDHQIRLSISFPTPYSKFFYCKNSRRYREKKQKVENDGKGGRDDSLMQRKISAAFKLSAQALYCTA